MAPFDILSLDLLAALALVMMFEGLALAIFAAMMPQLLAALEGIGAGQMRIIGIAVAAAGAAMYLVVRG